MTGVDDGRHRNRLLPDEPLTDLWDQIHTFRFPRGTVDEVRSLRFGVNLKPVPAFAPVEHVHILEGVADLQTGQNGDVVLVGGPSEDHRGRGHRITPVFPASRVMIGQVVFVEDGIARSQLRADPFDCFLSR